MDKHRVWKQVDIPHGFPTQQLCKKGRKGKEGSRRGRSSRDIMVSVLGSTWLGDTGMAAGAATGKEDVNKHCCLEAAMYPTLLKCAAVLCPLAAFVTA